MRYTVCEANLTVMNVRKVITEINAYSIYWIFFAVKMKIFRWKSMMFFFCVFFFLYFCSKHIPLEPPHRGGSNENQQSMF